MNTSEFLDNFYRQLPEERHSYELFEYLPDVYFFVKDVDGRFIAVNQLLVDKLGLCSKTDIIGKTDADIFSEPLAKGFEAFDREVLDSGKAIIDRVELISNYDNTIDWTVTTKLPLFDKEGNIAGIIGFTRDYEKTTANMRPFNEMSEVINYINENYTQNIQTKDLAKLNNQSETTFVRKFKKCFQTTPIKYINKVRVHVSKQLLIATDKTIGEIAFETGFCDQSHLTREFSKIVGMTPKNFRKQYFSK